MRTAESVRATICNESQTFRSPRLKPINSLRGADESTEMIRTVPVAICLLQNLLDVKYRLHNIRSSQSAVGWADTHGESASIGGIQPVGYHIKGFWGDIA